MDLIRGQKPPDVQECIRRWNRYISKHPDNPQTPRQWFAALSQLKDDLDLVCRDQPLLAPRLKPLLDQVVLQRGNFLAKLNDRTGSEDGDPENSTTTRPAGITGASEEGHGGDGDPRGYARLHGFLSSDSDNTSDEDDEEEETKTGFAVTGDRAPTAAPIQLPLPVRDLPRWKDDRDPGLDYREHRCLGEPTNLGKVLLVEHKVTKRVDVAKLSYFQKLHRSTNGEDPREEVAMLRLIGAASKNPHPGIVRLLDEYPEGGGSKYWAVLEWARGKDLFGLVSHRSSTLRRGLAEKDLFFLFRQLLHAFDHLHHHRGVAHLDMKLENLLLSEDCHRSVTPETRLLVCDFGMSRHFAPRWIVASTQPLVVPSTIQAPHTLLRSSSSEENLDSRTPRVALLHPGSLIIEEARQGPWVRITTARQSVDPTAKLQSWSLQGWSSLLTPNGHLSSFPVDFEDEPQAESEEKSPHTHRWELWNARGLLQSIRRRRLRRVAAHGCRGKARVEWVERIRATEEAELIGIFCGQSLAIHPAVNRVDFRCLHLSTQRAGEEEMEIDERGSEEEHPQRRRPVFSSLTQRLQRKSHRELRQKERKSNQESSPSPQRSRARIYGEGIGQKEAEPLESPCGDENRRLQDLRKRHLEDNLILHQLHQDYRRQSPPLSGPHRIPGGISPGCGSVVGGFRSALHLEAGPVPGEEHQLQLRGHMDWLYHCRSCQRVLCTSCVAQYILREATSEREVQLLPSVVQRPLDESASCGSTYPAAAAPRRVLASNGGPECSADSPGSLPEMSKPMQDTAMSLASSLRSLDSRPVHRVDSENGGCTSPSSSSSKDGGSEDPQLPDDSIATLVLKVDAFEALFQNPEAVEFRSSVRKLQGQIGTPRYMPPEVFYRSKYDPRSADMYTLGIVLFIASVGLTPFDGPFDRDKRFVWIYRKRKLFDLLKHWKFVDNTEDSSRNLCVDFVDLVQNLLCPPEQRFTFAQILNHSWFLRMSSKS